MSLPFSQMEECWFLPAIGNVSNIVQVEGRVYRRVPRWCLVCAIVAEYIGLPGAIESWLEAALALPLSVRPRPGDSVGFTVQIPTESPTRKERVNCDFGPAMPTRFVALLERRAPGASGDAGTLWATTTIFRHCRAGGRRVFQTLVSLQLPPHSACSRCPPLALDGAAHVRHSLALSPPPPSIIFLP